MHSLLFDSICFFEIQQACGWNDVCFHCPILQLSIQNPILVCVRWYTQTHTCYAWMTKPHNFHMRIYVSCCRTVHNLRNCVRSSAYSIHCIAFYAAVCLLSFECKWLLYKHYRSTSNVATSKTNPRLQSTTHYLVKQCFVLRNVFDIMFKTLCLHFEFFSDFFSAHWKIK